MIEASLERPLATTPQVHRPDRKEAGKALTEFINVVGAKGRKSA
jgi:hypothetical protein